MRFSAGLLALLLTAGCLLPASPLPAERLTFGVEWRLVHAGTVVIESRSTRAQMKLESAGLVSSLFKVDDTYWVDYDEPFCASSSLMDAREGKRHRETTVTYDGRQNRATFLERDVVNNAVIRSVEVEIPNCVNEVLGGLLRLRALNLEPGQSAQFPMSDGRRAGVAKVEAQEREGLTTPAGKVGAIRYEASLMNGVVYARKGRIFVWLTDDERRLPVQIRLRMQFPIGTVTLRLQKEERL